MPMNGNCYSDNKDNKRDNCVNNSIKDFFNNQMTYKYTQIHIYTHMHTLSWYLTLSLPLSYTYTHICIYIHANKYIY